MISAPPAWIRSTAMARSTWRGLSRRKAKRALRTVRLRSVSRATALERRLNGAAPDAFLIAKDIAGEPGFAAKRNGSVAVRHQFGQTGVTLSSETGNVWQDVKTSATGSPYRWTSVAVDRAFGPNWLSFGLSRLEEKESVLGGR